MERCNWGVWDNELYTKYHDEEWGAPEHDDNVLFEMIVLEGAQAGLSWSTVLKKRENYRKAFDGFNPKKVAKYDAKKVQELLNNEGIIRNKLKIASAIRNAKVFLEMQKEYGSFDAYMWSFLKDRKPIQNDFTNIKEYPVTTELSDTISKDLKKHGMNFIGSTIMYAYLQSIGMVNDHMVSCFRNKQVKKLS